MHERKLTIGEVAEATGLTTRAIRLYESRGLVEPSNRTQAGYRTYGPDEVALLRFVRQAKSIGLRLNEIGRIIDLQRSEGAPCSMVIDLLDARLVEIDRTMADLHSLRQTLAAVRGQARRARASGRDALICTVIEAAEP